jgi:hypothetical protein
MRALLQLKLLPLSVVGLCAGPIRAQSLPLDLAGAQNGENFGVSVANVDDINNDGWPDFAVGASNAAAGGLVGAGEIRILSRLGGYVIRIHGGTAPNEAFGASVVGLGDLNGDGIADYAAGSDGGSRVRAFSGATGLSLWVQNEQSASERFGYALARLPDLNGDGRAEVLVGAPGCDLAALDAGAAYILSGSNGAVLRTLLGSGLSSEYGYAVSSAGDVNADGVQDVLLGTNAGSNVVQVRSVSDGSVVRSFFGDSSLDWFGTAVAGIGDLDLDGHADVLIGASQGLLGPGYARVYSGQNGSLLYSISGNANLDLFGWSVCAAGDVNQDGRPDFAIGAPFAEGPFGETNLGLVAVHSGLNGTRLASHYGPVSDCAFGWSLAAGPGAAGIGGAPALGSSGIARAFDTGLAPGWINECVQSPNSVGPGSVMGASGSPSISRSDLILQAYGAPPNILGLFFYGRNAAQLPFGNGVRCVASPFYRRPAFATGPTGNAAQALPLSSLTAPGNPLPGELWRVQFWHRDPLAGGANFTTSDALRILFAP